MTLEKAIETVAGVCAFEDAGREWDIVEAELARLRRIEARAKDMLDRGDYSGDGWEIKAILGIP
jgi:hypothetical protein